MYPLLVSLMEEREREHARRNRHPWKRPEPKRESPVQWAIAAAATLRLNTLLHQHTTWEPMTPAEAQGVLCQEPPAIGTVKGESGRYVEAWMVQEGAPPARIKAVLELLRGYPV
jgi:hypothetical protein